MFWLLGLALCALGIFIIGEASEANPADWIAKGGKDEDCL